METKTQHTICMWGSKDLSKEYTEFHLLILVLLLNEKHIKITGGEWSKASFCPPGGRYYKGVTSCENNGRGFLSGFRSIEMLCIEWLLGGW